MSWLVPAVRSITRSRTAGVFRDPLPLDARRARLERASRTMPRPRRVAISADTVAGRPALRARAAESLSDAAILYLHGGSFVAGSPESHANLGARLARAAGTEVWLLDYRLAPEHPYPAAPDDAIAAASALRDAGVTRLALAGDSAGGGIALTATVELMRRNGAEPAALLLLAPWLDLSLSGPSVRTRIDADIMLDPATLAADACMYAGGETADLDVLSPLNADLGSLPPTQVQVGDRDILLSDTERFAELGREQGARIDVEVWDDMWHVWHTAAPVLPEANAAIRTAGAWLRAELLNA